MSEQIQEGGALASAALKTLIGLSPMFLCIERRIKRACLATNEDEK